MARTTTETKFAKLAGQQIELDPQMVQKNRKVWDVVSRTDPEFTKPVSKGNFSFTAIDGYYSVLRATELWGPFGQGWGYTLEHETISIWKNQHIAKVVLTLWYMAKTDTGTDTTYQRVECGPVIAMNEITRITSQGREQVDEEAFKKATTDALTKALSYLGFSADVFLGAFDDNRYVEQRKNEVAAKRAEKMPDWVAKTIEHARGLKDAKKLEAAFYAMIGNPKAEPPIPRNEEFAKLLREQQDYIILQFRKLKAELDPAEPEPADAAS